jgi:hypothetical protein
LFLHQQLQWQEAAKSMQMLADTLGEMETFLMAEKGVLALLPNLVSQQETPNPTLSRR